MSSLTDIRPATPVSSISNSRPVSPPLPPGSELVDINAFRPTASVSARCSKLKLRIFLDSNVFIAGGNIYGRMELTSATSRSLLLGEIAVELTGYEEVSCHEVTASQSFLSSRLLFQGAKVPPSNAVHGPAQKGHFWLARKGKTTFPFAFRIPSDAPSSSVFQTVASLRYVVTGIVQIFHSGQEDTVFRSKEACVIESFDERRLSNIVMDVSGTPVEASNTRRLFFGGPGALQLTAQLNQSVFTSGQNISLMVRVRNDTRRRVQGIKVCIGHRLRIYMAGKETPRIIAQIVHESSFNSKDFSFDPGVDRMTVVNVAAPSKARTSRQNSLFRIECFIVVACYIGALYRDLTVEIPITLLHAASLNKPADLDLTRNRYTNQYNLLDEDAIIEEACQKLESERKAEMNNELVDNQQSCTPPPLDMPAPTRRWLPWSSSDGIADHYSRTSSQSDATPPPPLRPPSSSSRVDADTPPIAVSLTSLAASDDVTQGRLVAASPSHAPVSPITYVPARERLRYVPFRAPSTKKAMDSPLRPLLYQNGQSPVSSSVSRPMSRLDEEQPSNRNSGLSSSPTPINIPRTAFRESTTNLYSSNGMSASPASSAVSTASGTSLERSPNTSPYGTPGTAINGGGDDVLSEFDDLMSRQCQANAGIMRTPSTGEGPSRPCTIREEAVLASSLPTNLERRYGGVSPSQFSCNASPRPLPTPPVKLPTSTTTPVTELGSSTNIPGGISRLLQWGATSFTQLVTGSQETAPTTATTTDNTTSPSAMPLSKSDSTRLADPQKGKQHQIDALHVRPISNHREMNTRKDDDNKDAGALLNGRRNTVYPAPPVFKINRPLERTPLSNNFSQVNATSKPDSPIRAYIGHNPESSNNNNNNNNNNIIQPLELAKSNVIPPLPNRTIALASENVVARPISPRLQQYLDRYTAAAAGNTK